MTLHPESRRLLDELAQLALPPIEMQTLDEARKRLVPPEGPLEIVDKVVDEEFEGSGGPVRTRRYHPVTGVAGSRNLLVFFHGGGWVIGSVETHEDLCRQLANACNAVVVSVDYRLAPESPFPLPVDDCVAGLEWAAGRREAWGVDGITGVAGDSAGGNLAAAVALKDLELATPQVECQVLLYPVTDSNLDSGSYLEFAEGYGLTRNAMAWFWEQYMGGKDASQPVASPLQAESLAGLPPTYIVTAEYDTLRDEGDAYAERLKGEGVSVASECVPGMLHGFLMHRDRFVEVEEVVGRIGRWARQCGPAKAT
ncbi:MAG TPA: hypothetical protein DCE47_10495 [Planctomycetaceae bacterium]|nr:hypothetical protein [Planctomycetaceae bacterium]HCC99376.1 hypothetical protein [Planctomycetaceae bacterium]|tara:strand:- start:2345 stop:3277 length:933 start_codon:yes stop_codon:yes gene_type:complete